ncbi:amino acid adenylation domain-containing protein [Fibrella sp. HMF5335]|uniref:Amino acid adenylation domain-containing protein n=1 Tax=Fibrella rubiginis TaxID=2817060 RepID=A0A939GEY9_9BACT|nr:non-ribosomal peptide synthetase [Fibrella rubiginis]MBO0935565.1 amino acid adenylation domain-containing protein [Fibrella rubiginis]
MKRATQPALTVVDFDPFAGPELVRVSPITDAQAEIWTACQFGGADANRAYNESVSLRLVGQLDKDAFEQAWLALVQRHEALRTAFSADGQQSCLFRELTGSLTYLDSSALLPEKREQSVTDLALADAQHQFDLTNGPLVKATLIKLDDTTHHFTLTAHHIICDGWSTGILLQDMGQLYSALVQGIAPQLAPAPQLGDYALAQQAYTESNEYRQHEAYWLNLYGDGVPLVDLPTDAPRPVPRTFAGNRVDVALEKELVQALKQSGIRAGCSLVTTLTAAFELWLMRLTHQRDLVLGLPAAGQAVTDLYGLVGHCVNLLPLRSHYTPEKSFYTHLRERRATWMDAFEHQRITFGGLLRKLQIRRDPARVSFVPVVFNVDMGLDEGVAFVGLSHTLISNPRAYENFELSLNATGSEQTLILEWSYNVGLFNEATIRAFHTSFAHFLQAVLQQPDLALAQIDAEETVIDSRKSITQSLPKPVTSPRSNALVYPRDKALTTLLSETAALYPNKTAIRYLRDALTFSELDQKANQLANLLLEQGVKAGDRVGLAVDRSLAMVVSMLGILKTGAAYVPVDPQHPTDRINYILADAACSVVLTSMANEGRFDTSLRELVVDTLWPTLAHYPDTVPTPAPTGMSIAYVLYTSGTTGRPKGAAIRHHSVANVLYSVQREPGLTAADKTLSLSTVAFDLSVVEIYTALLTGAELILVDPATTRNGELLAKLLDQESITFLQTTPAAFRMLLAAGWHGNPNLRVISCAEALPLDLAKTLLACCREVWNYYGPTETTIYATGKQILPTDERITIGYPIANTTVYIVDETGQLAQPGEAGELCIAGEGVSGHYLNQPELTAEKFIDNPFIVAPKGKLNGHAVGEAKQPAYLTDYKLYRTGDLARKLPDGDIVYMGRIDQQVKIRGFRIELGEVEHTLVGIDGIKEAVVMAREDRENDQRLVAYVVPELAQTDTDGTDWHQRWDVIYTRATDQMGPGEQGQSADLDVAIAKQLTNQTDIQQQADEWLGQSIKRLRALQARRVLEVGSGAGQLLFALADDTDRYIATDYAQPAIDNLNQKLATQPDRWAHVTAKTASADDYSLVEKASLDLVLIHSVAQYFPDGRYLLRAIEQAVMATAPGGCVFVGDMQSKQLQTMHHAQDQLPRSAGKQSVADFKRTVERRIRIDDELMADPAFFYLLPQLIPAITAVDVQLREGKSINETTKYHFDVWLYVGTSPSVVSVNQTIDWKTLTTAAGSSAAVLERELAQYPGQVVCITGMPNHRNAPDFALLTLLDITDPATSMDLVRAKLTHVEPGVDPDVCWTLGESMGYQTHVRWCSNGADNRFEAVFIPHSLGPVLPPPPIALNLTQADARAFVNEPYAPTPTVSGEQIRQWKKQAAQRLPDYMVPTDVVVLPRFPITANGKIDRKALPAPTPHATETDQHDAPTTPEEILLASLWADVLGMPQVGVDDNFFELGGHSMIAVQVMTRLEKQTGRRLPLATLFEYPTVRQMAGLIHENAKPVSWGSLVPIKPGGTRDPLYIVHGAGLNVLLFNAVANNLHPDQPVYGLQARGLNGVDEPFRSITEMAEAYVAEIVMHNPTGPYLLSGFSFGGIVAFEMARQLQEQGRPVGLVALFDAYAYDAGRSNPWWQRKAQGLGLFLNKVGHTLRLIRKHRGQGVAYKMESIDRRLIKKYWQLKPGKRLDQILARTLIQAYWQLKFGQQQQQEAIFDTTFRIEAINDLALEEFQLLPADLEVHLFRATVQTFFMEDYDFYGWRDFARKGVHVHNVPGEHSYIFAPPNDKVFADKLQAVLDRQ